jgi:hypothetical protein
MASIPDEYARLLLDYLKCVPGDWGFNNAGQFKNTITAEMIKPYCKKLSDWMNSKTSETEGRQMTNGVWSSIWEDEFPNYWAGATLGEEFPTDNPFDEFEPGQEDDIWYVEWKDIEANFLHLLGQKDD